MATDLPIFKFTAVIPQGELLPYSGSSYLIIIILSMHSTESRVIWCTANERCTGNLLTYVYYDT